jgi:hypothetical protein
MIGIHLRGRSRTYRWALVDVREREHVSLSMKLYSTWVNEWWKYTCVHLAMMLTSQEDSGGDIVKTAGGCE